MTQSKGLRTLKGPGMPASAASAAFAAFVTQRAVSVVMPPGGNTETRNFDVCIGFQGWRCGFGAACVGNTDEVLQKQTPA